MPAAGTFKIFVGNVSDSTNNKDLRSLFERYGRVVECDIVKNFAFVHMENEMEALRAIQELHNTVVGGSTLSVEAGRQSGQKQTASSGGPTTKLFVGNLPGDGKPQELRDLFSRYGNVVECDIIQNYAFVHIDTQDTNRLIDELDGYSFNGHRLRVQVSTSRVRQRPGMGNPQQCYRCGKAGHWSRDCSKKRGGSYGDVGRRGDDPLATYAHVYSSAAAVRFLERERLLAAYGAALPDPRDLYDRYADHLDRYYDDYRGDWRSSAARNFEQPDYSADPPSSRYGRPYEDFTRRGAADVSTGRSPLASVYDYADRQRYPATAYDDYYSVLGSSAAVAGAAAGVDGYGADRRKRYDDDVLLERRDGLRAIPRYAPY